MLHPINKVIPVLAISFLFFFSQQALANWGTQGPYGGTVKCMTVIDTFVYVGTPEGGLYRSTTRNAVAWKTFNNVMTTGKINAIAALGATLVVGSADQGVFLSTDNGVTWIQKNSGLTNTNIFSLHVAGTTLYAGTNGGGVFKSTNNGDSWTAVNSGLSNLTINTLTSASIALVAGTNGGVFYSTNGGTSWSAGNTGLTNLTVTSLATSGSTVFASTKGGGVFSANAATFSWSASNTGLTSTNVYQILVSGPTAYAATGTGVFTSATSAISWTAQNVGLPGDTVKALSVFENKLIAGTTRSGLYTSPLSTISWTERNKDFNNLKTYNLYVNGSLVIVATERGVYVSRNLAASYTLSNHGLVDSLNVNCFAFSGNTLYAGTNYHGVYASADTGKTWHAENTNISGTTVRLLVATDNKIVAVMNDNNMQTSALNTINWQTYSEGLQSNSTITSLTASADGNIFYAGTNDNGVIRRTTSDLYWMPFYTGMSNQHVSAIVIVGNKIFGATPTNGVFVSNLSSASWSLSNAGLPDLHITSMNTTGQYVVVGHKGGVYASSNNGSSWQPAIASLDVPSYTPATNIAFSTDRIFITTPSNSVYSNSKGELPALTVTSIFDEESSLNEKLLVSPNPNNGTFKLDYSALTVPASEVFIYNYSGQLMNTFYKGEESISVNYLPGIYLIRLKTQTNEWLTQKIIIQ